MLEQRKFLPHIIKWNISAITHIVYKYDYKINKWGVPFSLFYAKLQYRKNWKLNYEYPPTTKITGNNKLALNTFWHPWLENVSLFIWKGK